jgi:hypothetical protein
VCQEKPNKIKGWKMAETSTQEKYNGLIEDRVKGKTFADVGGLWGTKNERISTAVKAGATSATMIDAMPEDSDWWTLFHKRMDSFGLTGTYDSMRGNLDDTSLPERSGVFDFVHCSGIIYHVPSPFHTLVRLRSLTREFLLLGSMTVPERIETDLGEIDMRDGNSYFIPALRGEKKRIFKSHFDATGVTVHNINSEEHHPWNFGVGLPNYGPWWWLWTAETLALIAETAGFKLLHTMETWPGKAHILLLEAK